MKKIRILCIGAILMLGVLLPQEAFAYKYYVTLSNGEQVMFEADNSAAAVHYFRAHFDHGVLTKRPGGGLLDFLP